jgi:hypothetical protein
MLGVRLSRQAATTIRRLLAVIETGASAAGSRVYFACFAITLAAIFL